MKWLARSAVVLWCTALVCSVVAAYELNGPTQRTGAMFAMATIWCVVGAIVALAIVTAE